MDKVKFKKEFIQQYKSIINILKTFLRTFLKTFSKIFLKTSLKTSLKTFFRTEKFYSTEAKYNSYFLPIQLIIQTINVISIYFK